MKEELDKLKLSVERLRLDLMSSNLAIHAISSVLTSEQRPQVLKAFSELAVMQEQTAEKAQMPEVVAAMQQAHQRHYSALQGVMAMRSAKVGGTPPAP